MTREEYCAGQAANVTGYGMCEYGLVRTQEDKSWSGNTQVDDVCEGIRMVIFFW